MSSMEEDRLIAKIAHLYYMEDLDLKEIGKIFGVSYATISRLLKKGREEGIIKIIISSPYKREVEMEEKVKNILNLREIFSVYVEENYSYDNILNLLGIETARYLSAVLKDGDILGVSVGRTLYNVINNLHGNNKRKVTIVQLHGQMSGYNIEYSAHDYVRRLKGMFAGSPHFINSEFIVENSEIKKVIIETTSIKNTISLFSKINVALISVGAFPKMPRFLLKDYFTKEEMAELKNGDIIGNTVFNFFNISGQLIKSKIHDRVISISNEDFLNIDNKIMVAGGIEKTEAILGALRAGLANTLITDSITLKKINSLLEL